jgi:GSH-dependent disulfide-bond oxidoreductase
MHMEIETGLDVTLELLGARTGNCQRAAIALEEAGLEYTPVLVDLRGGQQRLASHLRLNPAGKVPVLVERTGGRETFVLSQSNAIMLHIADLGPNKLLPPENSRERLIAYERFMYVVTDVIAPSHAGFFMTGSLQHVQASMHHRRSLEALALSERFLVDSQFLAGETFTLADICAVSFAMYEAQSIDWERLPNLRRWFQEVTARPAVMRGFRTFERLR